jgi:hypothetical protein
MLNLISLQDMQIFDIFTLSYQFIWSEKMSRIFEITFRFDILWKPEYTNGTGYMMLTTKISDQV